MTEVIAWRRRRFDPRQLEEAIAVLAGILERLPEYVARQQAEGT